MAAVGFDGSAGVAAAAAAAADRDYQTMHATMLAAASTLAQLSGSSLTPEQIVHYCAWHTRHTHDLNAPPLVYGDDEEEYSSDDDCDSDDETTDIAAVPDGRKSYEEVLWAPGEAPRFVTMVADVLSRGVMGLSATTSDLIRTIDAYVRKNREYFNLREDATVAQPAGNAQSQILVRGSEGSKPYNTNKPWGVHVVVNALEALICHLFGTPDEFRRVVCVHLEAQIPDARTRARMLTKNYRGNWLAEMTLKVRQNFTVPAMVTRIAVQQLVIAANASPFFASLTFVPPPDDFMQSSLALANALHQCIFFVATEKQGLDARPMIKFIIAIFQWCISYGTFAVDLGAVLASSPLITQQALPPA